MEEPGMYRCEKCGTFHDTAEEMDECYCEKGDENGKEKI